MEGSSSSGQQNSNGEQRRTNPRPESTLALDFSDALDGAFNLNSDIASLGSTVEEKKQTVKSQNQELEALEARLKATEERLKKAGVQQSAVSGQQEVKSTSGAAVKTVPSGLPQNAPSRAPPGRPGVLAAASSIADRAPTPLDPRNEPIPGTLPETPSDRQQAADYYDQRRS